jgi:hypothetical protein
MGNFVTYRIAEAVIAMTLGCLLDTSGSGREEERGSR